MSLSIATLANRVQGGWLACLISSLLLAIGPGAAQEFPSRPIKIIVGTQAGTGSDIVARLVADGLSRDLGQAVIVENKPGASGQIAVDFVENSAADGYTILESINAMLTAAKVSKAWRFDLVDHFEPITLAGKSPMVIVASKSSGLTSIEQLLQKAAAEPGKLTYATPGIGTPHHIAMEALKDVAKIDLLHVPYKSSPALINDLLGGQVDLSMQSIGTVAQTIQSGGLVALAVVGDRHIEQVPNLPTLAEKGIKGVDADQWYAFQAPKGTPAPVIERLNKGMRAALGSPSVKEKLALMGIQPATGSPAELTAFLKSDLARWLPVIQKKNIAVQ